MKHASLPGNSGVDWLRSWVSWRELGSDVPDDSGSHWDQRRCDHENWAHHVNFLLGATAVGINYPAWLPHWDRGRCNRRNRFRREVSLLGPEAPHTRELGAPRRFPVGPEGPRSWELVILRGCPIGTGGAATVGIDCTVWFFHSAGGDSNCGN